MRWVFAVVCVACAAGSGGAQITTGTLLGEMADLERLARLPDPPYRTVQWSSYDRRSVGPESAGWYSNADGFGGELIPGFAAVLREPDERGVGLYLVGECDGPGAVVRTWTAGMDGVLRVYLDGNDEPLFEGRAADFLAHKTKHFLNAPQTRHVGYWKAFEQEDADYLPVAFARGLRITWEGSLKALHFYHVQIRRYPEGTVVETFTPKSFRWGALPNAVTASALDLAVLSLRAADLLGPTDDKQTHTEEFAIAAEERWTHAIAAERPRAISAFTVVVHADDRAAALRGTLLQIAFDGSERPQVEAPLGDFFGSGPGVNPFDSVPMAVKPDGTMTCRFVMPYQRQARVTLTNTTGAAVRGELRYSTVRFDFDERTMYLRARWRVDHDMETAGGQGPVDMPYLVLRGRGRLVGLACMIVNPSPIPTPGGNWWGEGDEKITVDDEAFPSVFGTGSEDYFNYSWSRPALFDHPYCGQPLDSGPGTAGYVSNHRWQILDDLPFESFLGCYMELWTHRPVKGFSYARICYAYARPGALDDHRPLTAAELRVPEIAPFEPVADGGARGATILPAAELGAEVDGKALGEVECKLASQKKVVGWNAVAGDRLRLQLPTTAEGAVYDVNVVAVHRPDGARVRASIGGVALGGDELAFRTEHATRVLSRRVETPALAAGTHVLELECVEPGFVGLDYLWIRVRAVAIPYSIEAESMAVVAESEGLDREVQALRGGWSSGRHLWIKATEAGPFVELRAVPSGPGRYHARLYLTGSYDYGILAVSIDGEMVEDAVDTYRPETAVLPPLDLGVIDVEDGVRVRLQVVGAHPKSRGPHFYFGVDCLVLEPVK